MRRDLEFGVLGPLEVRRGQYLVPVRGWREQTVLAMLLLADGATVTVERLVEAVWDGDPPCSAVKAVRNCVSALRRRLAEAGEPAVPIQAIPAGYRLPLGARLDMREFRQHTDAARQLANAGLTAQAVARLRAALGLWRGPALAGCGGAVIRGCAARLDEERISVLEGCLDLELALGRHQQVVSELQALAREHPLRERVWGQLMLALYRSNRQAEALDAYMTLAKRLAADLGINPAADIAGLHEAILRHDSSLDSSAEPDLLPAAATGVARWPGIRSAGKTPRPAQLPLEVPGFTGRTAELVRLRELLPPAANAERAKTTVVVSAIVGTAGVGKTTLAVRFAHEVAGQFPDGQLYADLHGFDAAESPAEVSSVLGGFLTALGIPAKMIPDGADRQAALYRSLLTGKRMLVLLDNARDTAQVRPLLPASPGCLVLVTSRSPLTGLVVGEGARPLGLHALTATEARQMLASRVGPDRLASEPDAADRLIGACAGLPLALAIAAARATARPWLRLTDLAAEVCDIDRMLDALETGDPATDVQAAFC
ncbi:MAG: transcriptional regulator [Streptosporangiaceae bacterium]|nr:transcriptional regulator [Streptosporangiaceae bacterium]